MPPISDQDRERVHKAINNQKRPTVTVLSSLLAVQDELRYIPDEAIEQVATLMDTTINDVFGVASFYPNFRFTPPGKMRDLPISNNAIRASIRRTRKLLATNFMTIHGYPPEGHLLIQNKPTKGYRLDPTIEAVNDSR